MLSGAVLAGGQSRRFGRNKALELFRGERLIDRGIEALRPLCDPILVVANDLAPYYDARAVLVQDVVPNQGPLGGLYTALLFSPHQWIFVKATDMPFFVPDLLTMMLNLKKGADVVVPLYRERHEPLLALYHRRCLPAVAEVLEGRDRKVIAFYRKVRVKVVAEEEWRSADPEGRSFRNVNTPEDWERLPWN